MCGVRLKNGTHQPVGIHCITDLLQSEKQWFGHMLCKYQFNGTSACRSNKVKRVRDRSMGGKSSDEDMKKDQALWRPLDLCKHEKQTSRTKVMKQMK